MPHRVRLVHSVLDGRFHVYTSPDLQGLYITAETQAEAQREAVAMLDVIAEHQGWQKPVIVFEDAMSLQAA